LILFSFIVLILVFQIGHRVLGLRVTDRASMKMCGFPDKDYKRWAAKLIQTGYASHCQFVELLDRL